MTDPPALWWTQTTVATVLVTTGAPELDPFPNNDFTADSLSSLTLTSLNLATTMSTRASLSTTMSSLVSPQTRSIASPRGDALPQTSDDLVWVPTFPPGASSVPTLLSIDATLGTASPSQPPTSLAVASSISGPGSGSSTPLLTPSYTALTTTVENAATVFLTPVTTSKPLNPAMSSLSRSSSPSTIVDPTVATTPPSHTTLSTAAKSGIAASTSLIVILFLGILAVFWRKRRSAETKRGNDLESKAIWVKKTFTVETKARSSDSVSGSPQSNTNSSSVIPAAWMTVPREDARVAKRWADVDVIGGLTRWSQRRKGVHGLRE